MFENLTPISKALDRDDVPGDLLVGSRDPVPGRGGDALRAMQWSELTARLNAARDLRRVLRRDARHNIASAAASFGDAAATYFESLGNGERAVNPVALGASKASCATFCEPGADAASGDTRDMR
ncbi:hypothetical protein [Erythrobacter sp. JK5]|uniref:hypothetical protein n=1 Tax=Erythrobacter sp. JK5 TaxID=2829500 RepID=UPI001BA87F68|nr:hypothetical protein [Erythrobacter sp. JK5]QUL37363.1 hypothetical protein KDC96_13485 [Erythrobacter sp. JK5]